MRINLLILFLTLLVLPTMLYAGGGVVINTPDSNLEYKSGYLQCNKNDISVSNTTFNYDSATASTEPNIPFQLKGVGRFAIKTVSVYNNDATNPADYTVYYRLTDQDYATVTTSREPLIPLVDYTNKSLAADTVDVISFAENVEQIYVDLKAATGSPSVTVQCSARQ